MLHIPISKLRPGMVVAKPVCHARQRIYFVQKGFTLDKRSITRLAELGASHLWVTCPGLESVAVQVNDEVAERRTDLVGLLADSVERLRRRTDASVDCGAFEKRVGDLLAEILDDPTHEPILASMSGDCGALVRHMSNCCYLTLLLGTHLSGYVRHQRKGVPTRIADDIRLLGVGAYVHDIGKVRLSDEAQEIHALHRRYENTEYQSHVRLGADMLRGGVSPVVLYMVMHHHQRFDGTGFPIVKPRDPSSLPGGLSGDRIHVFARILAVADAFEHLLSDIRGPRATVQALYALQQPELQGRFDPVVVAALNRVVPPFMVGSVVTLSDESEAVVVANHAEAPCEPTVRLIHGEPGAPDARVESEDIDVRYTPGLSVAYADGVDVRPYFFRPVEGLDDGALAYWGVRTRAIQNMHVDPSAIMSSS